MSIYFELSLLLFLSGVVPAAEGPGAEQFTIATYNINYGNPNLKLVVETILKSGADLVALQETNRESELYLKRHLSATYPFMKFHRAAAAGGFGFLSRIQFKDPKHVPAKVGYFGAYLATIRIGGRDMQLASVHLHPTIPENGDNFRSFWMKYIKTQAIRRVQIRDIEPQLSTRLPRIILGDFNSFPNTDVQKYLESKKYTDSYKSVVPAVKRKHTWHWRIRGVDWKYRLDYIFHSEELKTLKSSILRTEASDHYLVKSVIRWKT